jgi:hypothetical protein
MLVRSQDNEKITDRIEFLITETPEKGWGVYQSERLFGEYGSLEKAIKALDMLEESYNRNGKVAYMSDGTLTTMICNLFQFPAEEEIPDEE